MKLTELQTLLKDKFPENIIYQRAQKIRRGKNRYPRTVAMSKSGFMNLEIIGDPRSLSEVKFMLPLDDLTILQRNTVAVKEVADAFCGAFVAGVDWLMTLLDRKTPDLKNARISYITLENINFAFVTLRKSIQ
jgi:hypothetical protein